MQEIDPDSKNWKIFQKENPEWSINTYSELTRASKVKHILKYFFPNLFHFYFMVENGKFTN
jgi:hypothetical protein